MVNAINYAEKYQRELDQKLTQGLLTAELETPNVNWLDAKTFKVPTVVTGGYKAHSRNGGYNRGSVEVTHETYTLDFDRDVEFFVDRADVDESNQAASAANVTNVFTNEQAIPETDAYRFSKLATVGTSADEAITSDNVVATLKQRLLPIRKYGPSNIIIYVSSAVMDALEQSTKFTRNIDVQTGQGVIDTRVTAMDGVQIKEVWDSERFYTAFDFTDGFTPDVGAKQINYMIVAKPAVIAKAKYNSVYLFQPGQHTQGDGYLYQNRMYGDLFVMAEKTDGVFTSTIAAVV